MEGDGMPCNLEQNSPMKYADDVHEWTSHGDKNVHCVNEPVFEEIPKEIAGQRTD